LHRIGLELCEPVMVGLNFANQILRSFKNDPFLVWQRENTPRNFSLAIVFVEVNRNLVLCLWKLHHVELVVSLLHFCFPVIILVVVALLEEFL